MSVPKPATVEELAKRGVRVKPLEWCADTVNWRNWKSFQSRSEQMIVADDLIADAINTRLRELQRACAIERHVLRENRRAHYEPYEESRRHINIRNCRQRVREAERALAAHVAKYRHIMGDGWAPHAGRLCWSSVLGGMPIDQHYCDLPEGHDGPHSTGKGCWTDADAAKRDRRWTIYEEACHAAAVIKPKRFCWLPRVG